MKTRISTTIEAGDIVHQHKRLWLVETMQAGRPCSIQCAMYDAEADKCCGYCYRWSNGDDKVFRYLLPDTAVKDATEVVETPDLLAARITDGDDPRKASQLKYYEKVKEARATKEKRPYGRGSVYQNKGAWVGDICVNGRRYTYRHPNKVTVEAWLDKHAAKSKTIKKS